MLLSIPANKKIYHSTGNVFCPTSRTWKTEKVPYEAIEVSTIEAIKILQFSDETRIRVPIGIVGTRSPTDKQYEIAETIGEKIASLGFTVLCGGKTGIMEAACKGVMKGSGISVGLLPDEDPSAANKFVTIPIASGIGVARNALIARSSLCLVVIGGGYGTISEIAYGLQFGKNVLGIEKQPYIDGMEILDSIDNLIQRLCSIVFCLSNFEVN